MLSISASHVAAVHLSHLARARSATCFDSELKLSPAPRGFLREAPQWHLAADHLGRWPITRASRSRRRAAQAVAGQQGDRHRHPGPDAAPLGAL
jgi:hypothetical protein